MTEYGDMDVALIMPSLKQKFLVDLVNGIDVSHDHIKVQKERDGFLARLWDSYTGDSHRRQSHVNELIVTGLDSSLQWLSHQAKELTLTNRALTEVSNSLCRVKNDMTELVNFSADTREQLELLQHTVDHRFRELESQIREVDMRQRAYQQIDSLFTSWAAGNFSNLSYAQRCFLVISELEWGVFGEYYRLASDRDQADIQMYLRDRLIVQILQEENLKQDSIVNTEKWLSYDLASPSDTHRQQAVLFLGDNLDKQRHPLTHYALNPMGQRPSSLSYFMAAPRLVEKVTSELFREEYRYAS